MACLLRCRQHGSAYSDLEKKKATGTAGYLRVPNLWLELQVEPPPEGSGPTLPSHRDQLLDQVRILPITQAKQS